MTEALPSPVAILARAAARAPAAPALHDGGVRLDYAAYGAAVAGFAAQLRALGAEGGRVALLLGNSAQMAIGCFAVQAADAALVPLNPDYTAGELAPALARARPHLLVTFPERAARLTDLFQGELLVLPADAAAWIAALPADAPLGLPDPDAVGLIPFTGGTTGLPKGVMLTHRAIAANVAQREAVLPTAWADERVPVAMPLYHSFAASMGLLLAANCAGSLHLLPRYRPDWLQDLARAERLTRLPAGPTLLASLLQWDGFDPAAFATLRSVWSGSAPLPAALLERWQAATGVPVHEGYGQTEAGPVLAFQGPRTALKPLSVGPAVPGTEIRILDARSRAPLPAGETGEIAARGPQLMAGYLDDTEATAQALVDGWLMTGDIGRLDADGHLFITDRAKDMAIVGGFNVYPREVDEVLQQCPGVTAAAAVAAPDAYRGEVLWAWVEGCASEADLVAHCEAHLVRYKRPVRWWLEPIPRTAIGKLDKAELKRRARAAVEAGHVA